jgi:type IV secretion system protein VirD4
MVVNDIKGELCAMTQKHRRDAGGHIIRLNPFNVLGMGSDGFNPIASLDLSAEFPDDALELAEAIIRLEGKEPHWAQAAQEWVAAIIMYVRLVIPDASFSDVRALLGQDDDRIRIMVLSPGAEIDGVEYYFNYRGLKLPGMIETGIRHGWEEIGIKAARFGDITPENREIHSVISTALTQTRWLDSRPVKDDLAKNPFDYSVMKDRPVTVYLILPARRLITHSSWLRLMIASIVQKLMRDTKKAEVPVLLMLDEYAALAGGASYGSGDSGDGFPVIARNMPMFRGYGLKLWTVWQDLAQAKRIYGPEGFESFLANSGIVQIFAPQDVVTAEYFSQMSGQNTRRPSTRSRQISPNPAAPGGVQVSDSVSQTIMPLPLLLPQDIRNCDTGFSLVFSNLEKGPVPMFVPWPGELRHLRAIMALDPSA